MKKPPSIRLAIAGMGAIGMRVAQMVDAGGIKGMHLVAVSANDVERAARRVVDFDSAPSILPIEVLVEVADVIVECAPAALFEMVATPVIENGKCLMTLSVGALLKRPDLIDKAASTGAQIVVPTGALIGLDTVRAMAVGEIHSVTLTTRKPPNGLMGAPHLMDNNISINNLTEPFCVFRGTAREAAAGFPANVNVAAALALAGIGADKTSVEIWADPTINRNIQSVTIESDSGEATMTINNIPSQENPKTGRIVANSVIASLQRMTATLVAGS